MTDGSEHDPFTHPPPPLPPAIDGHEHALDESTLGALASLERTLRVFAAVLGILRQLHVREKSTEVIEKDGDPNGAS